MKMLARFVPNEAGFPLVAVRIVRTDAQAKAQWLIINRWMNRLENAGVVDGDSVRWFNSLNPARECEA